MSSIVVNSDGVSILYDPQASDQPTSRWFNPGAWQKSRALGPTVGGRGPAYQVSGPDGDFVLRHYYRGGLPGRLLTDTYLFTGLARTRAFAEWRLLQTLYKEGLPVPKPFAAGVSRTALWYRADLLTVELPGVRSLAALSAEGLSTERWRAVGVTLRQFHDRGVFHADLNANNIQLDAEGVWLLDFDRGALRSDGAWKQATLNRLLRSLNKLWQVAVPAESDYWRALKQGYSDRRV